MEDQELKLIDFITHLPPNVNPYYETAKMLEIISHSPRSPVWSRHLRIAVLILIEIMFFQSAYLLYLRYRIKESPGIKYNNLGLVIVNISITSSIAYFVYSMATIYVLLSRVVADSGQITNEADTLIVFGVKFFVVILASWAFFWVCVCQCAKVLWSSNLASKVNRNLLKFLIKWGFSSLFVCVSLGPLFPIALKYGAAYRDLHEIQSTIQDLTSRIRLEGAHYDPQHYSQMSLLSLLIPAKKLIPLQDRMENNLRGGQYLYFADLCLLSLVYLPTLFISLRALYKQSISQTTIDAAVGGNQSKESPISSKIRRQRQRLVYHAFCVYFATSVHLPMVLYQIIVSRSPGFSRTMIWQEITFQGMNIPLAITGNIILFILNIQSYLTFREKNRRDSGNTPILSKAEDSGPNFFQKLSICGFGFLTGRSEDDAIDLEDLETQDIEREMSLGRAMSLECAMSSERARSLERAMHKKPMRISLKARPADASNTGIKITQLTFSTCS